MTDTNSMIFRLPPDFAERCRATNARIESGEAMTMQYLADQLGIPFEFFAAASGIAVALQTGQRVIIDPQPLPKSN
jgi:hypothetical protein